MKFAAAIKDTTEEDSFLVISAPLLGSPLLGNRILVRKSYLMLWDRLQQLHFEKAYTSFVITGQPGVGKTFWLIWLLIRWGICVCCRLSASLTTVLASSVPSLVLSRRRCLSGSRPRQAQAVRLSHSSGTAAHRGPCFAGGSLQPP